MSLKKERFHKKKSGRPIVTKTKSKKQKAREYVRAEWENNPTTSRSQLIKDVKEKYDVSVKPDTISDWTDDISKPSRDAKKYIKKADKEIPERIEQERVDVSIHDRIQKVFNLEFGVDDLNKNNIDWIIKQMAKKRFNRKQRIRRSIARELLPTLMKSISVETNPSTKERLIERKDLLRKFITETDVKHQPHKTSQSAKPVASESREEARGWDDKKFGGAVGLGKKEYHLKKGTKAVEQFKGKDYFIKQTHFNKLSTAKYEQLKKLSGMSDAEWEEKYPV